MPRPGSTPGSLNICLAVGRVLSHFAVATASSTTKRDTSSRCRAQCLRAVLAHPTVHDRNEVKRYASVEACIYPISRFLSREDLQETRRRAQECPQVILSAGSRPDLELSSMSASACPCGGRMRAPTMRIATGPCADALPPSVRLRLHLWRRCRCRVALGFRVPISRSRAARRVAHWHWQHCITKSHWHNKVSLSLS